MTNIIYQSIISSIGDCAADMLSDGMLIMFDEGCPADLADYCFTHSHGRLNNELTMGQTLKLGNYFYTITAVGSVANTNFRELGHLTVRFDGQNIAELPGTIHVNGDKPNKLCVGDNIVIINNE